MLLKEKVDEIKKDFCTFSSQDVCEHIVKTLHYPTVLIDKSGKILFKNKKDYNPFSEFRKGAFVKKYVGENTAKEILTATEGSYITIDFKKNKIAVLGIDEYIFLILLSPLEIKGEHRKSLYDYMENITDRAFTHMSENAQKIPQDSLDKWNIFLSKFNNNYEKSIFSCSDIYVDALKIKPRWDHEINMFIEGIKEIVSQKKYGFVLKRTFPKKRSDKICSEFIFKCAPDDMGALFCILLFLCLQCSNKTKNNVINVENHKNQNFNACLVTLSVNSDIEEKELNSFFKSGEVSDVKALYFHTAKNIALKYCWGVDVEKADNKLIFKLFLQCTEEGLILRDSSPKSVSESVSFFDYFIRLLFDGEE